jgi:hypothetical protein
LIGLQAVRFFIQASGLFSGKRGRALADEKETHKVVDETKDY